MKTSARFLAMLLAVVMIASAALSVSAFSDVTAGVDHAQAIGVLSQLGVIGGYEDGTFKPDQKVTRAEMAKLVYVLYTTFVDAGTGSVKFDDVKADNWAVGYISWCYNKGIIGGYGNGKFGPSDNVTYDQALKMVCGTLGYNEWDSTLWPIDVRTKALRELNLGAGIEGVNGSDALTRAQVAQIMYNALFADMNETKTVNVPVAGTGYVIPVEVKKTLAEDVWAFIEETYAIVGTENNGNKTSDEATIAIAAVDAEGDIANTSKEVTLEDLGLTAFEGKTDDLIGLWIVTVTKDDEMLASASILGSVIDNVEITYTSDYKTLTINGVKYTAEDVPALVNADGSDDNSVTIFDEDGKLTTEFRQTVVDAYFARIIDVDGDAEVDAFVMVPQTAYKVASITTKSNVKYVNYKALDESGSTLTVPVANVTADLKKDDIFVGAKMGNTLYAEVITPVETYATKLSTTAGEVTLDQVGKVSYKNVSVAGVPAISLTTDVLNKDNAQLYYIYGNEVIFTDASKVVSAYDFAILKDIELKEGEFNNVTMENSDAYVATLIVDGAETQVTLADDGAVYVNDVEYSAEQAYDAFKAGENADGKREYKYTVVAAYEKTDAGYVLTINKNLDADAYAVVPAGSTLKYNATTGLYSVGSYKKVELDANSAIYYRYDLPHTASGSFMYLGKYTQDKITTKAFEIETYGETYLAYNEATKTYTLLTTIVKDEIVGATEETKSYVTDGRLVMYAPESSAVELHEGKTYNSYVFMDNATLTNKEPVVDTTVEHDDANDTVAGGLYGWNPTTEVYDAITADDELNTVKGAVLTDVIASKDLVGFKVGSAAEELVKIADDVTIWGLAEEDKLDVYTQLTLEELGEMLTLVNDYNEDKETEYAVDMIIVSYKDSNDDYIISSIIVEIYTADEDGVVTSVNDAIFTAYNA